MSDKTATATATATDLEVEVERELDKINIEPEFLQEFCTNKRKRKRKHQSNNNEHDSTVPVRFTNQRPGKAKFVVAWRNLRLPEVMAQAEPIVPLSNDPDWNKVQLLAEMTAEIGRAHV